MLKVDKRCADISERLGFGIYYIYNGRAEGERSTLQHPLDELLERDRFIVRSCTAQLHPRVARVCVCVCPAVETSLPEQPTTTTPRGNFLLYSHSLSYFATSERPLYSLYASQAFICKRDRQIYYGSIGTFYVRTDDAVHETR